MQTIRFRLGWRLWVFFLLLGGWGALRGQPGGSLGIFDSSGGFPGGVPWRVPSEDGRWSIEMRRVRLLAEGEDHPLEPVRVRVQQFKTSQGTDFFQVQETISGALLQTWALGAWIYHSREGTDCIERQLRFASGALPGRGEGLMDGQTRNGSWKNWREFEECGWIRPEFCVGVSRWAGRDYLIYREASPEVARSIRAGEGRWCKVAGMMFPVRTGFRSAVVQLESRLPKVVQHGGAFFLYDFDLDGTGSLEMPLKLRTFLADCERRTRAALTETVRPF